MRAAVVCRRSKKREYRLGLGHFLRLSALLGDKNERGNFESLGSWIYVSV